MRHAGRITIAVSAVAVLAVLFVVLRPAADHERRAGTTTDAATGTNTATAAAGTNETETRSEVAPAGPFRVTIAVRGGGGRVKRIDVEQGRRVVLTVTADVADHIHVHGYDLLADVAPGRPARLSFRAEVPGRFEIELEDRHRLIAELTVTP